MICQDEKEVGTKESDSRVSNYKERFNRWHGKQIDLLSSSISLLFTLTFLIIGFLVNNWDKEFIHSAVIFENFSLKHTVGLCLSLSTIIGLLALTTRLNDFRITKNVVRLRRRKYEVDNDIKHSDYKTFDSSRLNKMIKNKKCCSRVLGYLTWILFYLQITFLLSALLLMVISLSV